METTTKKKIAAVLVYTLVIFAVGRYTASVKIKESSSEAKKTDTTITKNVDLTKNTHTETTQTERVLPDGTKETTIKIVKDDSLGKSIDTHADKKSTDTKAEDKTIERGQDKVNISLLGGYDFTNTKTVYGMSVVKPILGPISCGLWGLNNATVGASIGLSF